MRKAQALPSCASRTHLAFSRGSTNVPRPTCVTGPARLAATSRITWLTTPARTCAHVPPCFQGVAHGVAWCTVKCNSCNLYSHWHDGLTQRQVPRLNLVLPHQPARGQHGRACQAGQLSPGSRVGLHPPVKGNRGTQRGSLSPPAWLLGSSHALEEAGGGAGPAVDQPIHQTLHRQLPEACTFHCMHAYFRHTVLSSGRTRAALAWAGARAPQRRQRARPAERREAHPARTWRRRQTPQR